MVATLENGIWQVDAKAYHADTSAVSHSMLEDFRRSIPLYHGRYVVSTLQRDEPTPSMVLGTALHALVLQPERFDDLVAVAPECDRRTKAGKTALEEFQSVAVGKTVISREQHWTARQMVDGIQRNSLAWELLQARGRSELSLRWEHPFEVACKSRLDRVADGFSLDVKTSVDPSPDAWSKQAAGFGYHRQQAFYQDALRKTLDKSGPFYFVVVGNSPPYECAVYQLDEDAVEIGRQQNAELIAELQNCLLCDQWEGRWSGQVYRVKLPAWAF